MVVKDDVLEKAVGSVVGSVVVKNVENIFGGIDADVGMEDDVDAA